MEKKRSICMFCSMGCGFVLASKNGVPSHIEYDLDNPINKGSLCPRGNSSIELVKNVNRIEKPSIKMDGATMEAGWDEALGYVAQKIQDIKKKHGAKSIGVVISPTLTNEEIYLAGVLARDIIKTSNFDVAFSSDDDNLVSAMEEDYIQKVPTSTVTDIDSSECILIVGDQLSKAPCSSKNIMNAKYTKKGTKVIVLEPKASHTAWFSTTHIQMKPGTEWVVLLGMIKAALETKKAISGKERTLKRYLNKITIEEISKLTNVPPAVILNSAKEFASSKKGTIVISSGFDRIHPLTGTLCKLLASISKGKKGILPFYTYMNSNGA
ncbi:molybdopterin oxidoreductase family protein, partial [Candidatus Margulisiibacteriota bacterium]